MKFRRRKEDEPPAVAWPMPSPPPEPVDRPVQRPAEPAPEPATEVRPGEVPVISVAGPAPPIEAPVEGSAVELPDEPESSWVPASAAPPPEPAPPLEPLA
ncbi:MAG: hypothetical protein H0T43_09695, partial [Solirubrobacterales bacterium]|nr:hypothetical protein [Solirubrobacterales bacterium]